MEILALYARRNNGLHAPNIPPLWAYIPTALFFIQAAIWAQMEYRTKSLAPWQQMATGPSSATRSLLVDYLSPLNLSTCVRSIQLKHHAVALAIFGSVILKLLIISAGALISPRSAAVTTDASLALLNAFSGTLDTGAVTANNAFLGVASLRNTVLEPGIGVNGTWAYQSLAPLKDPVGQ